MTPLTSLVAHILLYSIVAIVFLFSTLLIGKLVRPNKPNPEKEAIYECGEPTIGSSWVQFDLRFYVVALLFVVFDVEVAFFFPWAVVFGKTIRAADPAAEPAAVAQAAADMGFPKPDITDSTAVANTRAAALSMGRVAFVDLLVFFGVVLVGFAYLWKRGDLDWVRSMAAEAEQGEERATWSEAATKATEPAEPAGVS